MPPAVEITHLSVTRQGKTILDDITCHIPQGAVVGVIGPSGAGKTTLLRALVGVQKISQGQAIILGQPAGTASLRSQIGYMTQSLSIYTDLSVQENLFYFGRILNVSSADIKNTLKLVELDSYAAASVSQLSGGQKARVSLAVALLGQPKLLILDEPTVGLDPVLRQKLWQQFHQLASQGTTLLVSSHVMDEASRCDSLLLIRDGKLLANDTPQNLCHQTNTKTVEQAFLSLVNNSKVETSDLTSNDGSPRQPQGSSAQDESLIHSEAVRPEKLRQDQEDVANPQPPQKEKAQS